MNAMLSREFLSQLIIIVAACVGGWVMIVEPKIAELEELQVMIAEVEPIPAGQASIEQMADRVQDVRARLDQIDQRNSFARDTSNMYSVIMDLAEEHGVVVRELAPGAADRAAEPDSPVHVTELDLTVQGGYEAVAVFLSELESLRGFLRPASLTVTPRQEEGRRFAEARFSCDVVRFTLPEALAAMLGADDADE